MGYWSRDPYILLLASFQRSPFSLVTQRFSPNRGGGTLRDETIGLLAQCPTRKLVGGKTVEIRSRCYVLQTKEKQCCVKLHFSFLLSPHRAWTKKDLGSFKIHRAVVDSSRSVNLPFNIRKILCTYPRKRKDIRDLKMFQIGDLSSFLAGGLTCIRCRDLFVSWSGCREDQSL